MKGRTEEHDRLAQEQSTTKPTGRVRHSSPLEEKESRDGVVLEHLRGVLLEHILHPDNLTQAWQQVRRNKGVAGIDGASVSDFPEFYRQHGESIRQKLEAGTYAPSPVKRVEIPKPDGGKRPLGIPTVLDRVIQQAIAQQLSPQYERQFSMRSYGFRPGRSAHGAIQAVLSDSKSMRGEWVVDCDLKSFFDTVNHDVMMNRLSRKISDPRVLSLIRNYLKAGVMHTDGRLEASTEGMPQGGPLSPLLSNILLDELDKELEKRGHKFARYADDFVILCRSPRAGQRIMDSITRFIEGRLKLVVNRVKSAVRPLAETTFLGFAIVRGKIVWSEKAQQNFKHKVKQITKRSRGVSPATVTADLTTYVRGAVNYYAIGMPFGITRELDGWVRQRVRLYYWKQWGRPKARRRNLLKLGVPRTKVHMASRSRKGHWRISNTTIVRTALHNEWLEAQGVPNLVNIWKSIRYPEQPETLLERIQKL